MERGKLWRTAFGNNLRLLELNGIIRKLHGLPGAI